MDNRSMDNRVKHIENMKRFIQHRERVLDMKSVVKTQAQRSKSVPKRNSNALTEHQRKIEKENQRLLQSLIRIAHKPSTYSKK